MIPQDTVFNNTIPTEIASSSRKTSGGLPFPTELERGFLRVATRGYPELEEQIESCEISEYDVAGFCYVNALAGPPSPELFMAKGPVLDLTPINKHLFEITNDLRMADPKVYCVLVSLTTDRAGMLSDIEVVSYGDGYLVDPYRLFVDAAATGSPALTYPGPRNVQA